MHLISIGRVAKLGGCTPTAVRDADDVLQPERDTAGRRLYDPERVSDWLAARAERRASKEHR